MITISWLVGAEKPWCRAMGGRSLPRFQHLIERGHPLPKKDEPWESIILWLTLGLR